MLALAHCAVHVPALMSVSEVHGMPSLQAVGQLPWFPAAIALSHSSFASTMPLPHVGEQSESVVELHAAGQQPSPAAHAAISVCAQTAWQVPPSFS